MLGIYIQKKNANPDYTEVVNLYVNLTDCFYRSNLFTATLFEVHLLFTRVNGYVIIAIILLKSLRTKSAACLRTLIAGTTGMKLNYFLNKIKHQP